MTQTHTDSSGNTINFEYDSVADVVKVNFSAVNSDYYIVESQNENIVIKTTETDEVLSTWSDSQCREAVNAFFLANKVTK
jgi:hypothetical protein